MTEYDPDTFVCPNCGAIVSDGAAACPECGSDDETGWSPDTDLDDIDLPDPGYGEEQASHQSRYGRWVAVAAVLVILGIALLMLLGGWK